MKVERRIVKSISEFSVFKFALVAYLIFFILFVIIFAIIGLIGWALIAASGVVFADVLNSLIPGLNLSELLGGLGIGMGGSVLGMVLFVVLGLIASVFVAAGAAVGAWLVNVVLKIIGGIELRFAPDKNLAAADPVSIESRVQQL
jgi:MFS family permease